MQGGLCRPAAASSRRALSSRRPSQLGRLRPRNSSWLRRRLGCPPPPCAGLFDGLFKGQGRQPAQGSADEEAQQEEDTMIPLDASSDVSVDGSQPEPFGPLAMLAVGFPAEEFQALQGLLEQLEADMIRLIPCSAALLEASLGQALEVEEVPAHEPVQVAAGAERVVFLSGMYAGEVMDVIGAYKDAGLPDTAFAAAVPNNYGRALRGLVQAVSADHQARKAWAAQQRQQEEQQGGSPRAVAGRPAEPAG